MKLTQRLFAARVDMDPSLINRLIKGVTKRPSWDNAKKIAAEIGRSPGEVMDNAGTLISHYLDNYS